MPTVRRGEVSDLDAIEVIQKASPEAAQWSSAEYLQYDLLVAVRGVHVVGFAVFRTVAPGEREILNLAVTPKFRRQGIARFVESSRGELSWRHLPGGTGFQPGRAEVLQVRGI